MSVLTLAIGIGACALMMSLVSSILLEPLPYARPEQLEMVWGYYPDANLGFPEQPTHGAVFRIMRDNLQAFESIAAFRGASLNLGDAGNPERLDGVEATGDFFRTLGVSPQIGRFFERENETAGADRVVVLSDSIWRRRFGADPQVVGRVLTLNAEPYVVIGIAPHGFAFPRGSEMPGDFQFAAAPEAWIPLEPPKNGIADLAIVGRLREGTTTQAARQDMDRVMEIVQRTIPVIKNSRPREWLVPLREQVVGDVTAMLVSLLAGVALVLLAACVNTSQLVLAQLEVRRRELALRSALGASTRRLAAEVLTEVSLLVATGGALGIAAAVAALRLVRAYGSQQLPRISELAFDTRAAFAALGVMAATAIVVTLVSVAMGGRAQPADALRRGGRGSASGSQAKARRALIVCQVAGSLVLLASAGLLVHSLSRQLGAKLGFDAVHGVTFEVSLPPVRYPERRLDNGMDHAAGVRFLTSALDSIRALPGITAAGIGKPLPLSGTQQASVFTPEGKLPPLALDAASPIAQYTVASPGMLAALGAPILAGRDFSDDDRADGLPVVIVNEAMAKWLWPGELAIGKRIRLGRPQEQAPMWPWMTVVGVVSDMKRYALTETPRPEMIVPYTQNPYLTFGTMQFVVRSRLESSALLRAVQRAIAAEDPTIPIANARTVDDLVSASASNSRFVTRLMAGFGLAALLLTVVGVYGVVGYGVQQRRQEFGVRRAIGASARDILALIIREALALTGAGIAVGLALALAAGLWLRHLLFDTSPFDPVSLAGAMAVICAATIVASLIPAITAARVEPRAALED